MPDIKEKLVALLSQVQNNGFMQGDHVLRCANISNGVVADHLIANGVTFATDNNVVGKQTQADRIRAMSDEELAEVLYVINSNDICLNPTYSMCDRSCPFHSLCIECKQGRELNWLKQPAEGVHHE